LHRPYFSRRSLAITQEAERIGFTRLVITHPLVDSVGATREQMKEMVKRGAYIEFCALNIFAGNNLNRIPEFIAEFGADHCILSTDAFREWIPPGPEFLRMFIGRLLMVSGIDEEALRTMVQRNPAFLLDCLLFLSHSRLRQGACSLEFQIRGRLSYLNSEGGVGMPRLEKKVAIVTGGGHGIGVLIVKAWQRRGLRSL